MVAGLEPLDASWCAGGCHHVFALVPVLPLGRWQTFALDWQERVELGVPTAFDNQDRATGLGRKIDGPSATDFVRNFGAELNPAPPD